MNFKSELEECIHLLNLDGANTKMIVRDRLELLVRREDVEAKLTDNDIDLMLDLIDHNLTILKKALTLDIDNKEDVEERISDLERVGMKLRKVQKR